MQQYQWFRHHHNWKTEQKYRLIIRGYYNKQYCQDYVGFTTFLSWFRWLFCSLGYFFKVLLKILFVQLDSCDKCQSFEGIYYFLKLECQGFEGINNCDHFDIFH